MIYVENRLSDAGSCRRKHWRGICIEPPVQRIRELLGTGSNSTIAEHLKIWREQHAAKKVHYLPAFISEELINTFETLWQTAMEHAERHLSDVKESLISQEEIASSVDSVMAFWLLKLHNRADR